MKHICMKAAVAAALALSVTAAVAKVPESELARLGHVSRARMTQIMNLLIPAPQNVEALRIPSATTDGRDPVHEKTLRPVAAEVDRGSRRRRR